MYMSRQGLLSSCAADEGDEEREDAWQHKGGGAVLIEDGRTHRTAILSGQVTHDDNVVGGRRRGQYQAD